MADNVEITAGTGTNVATDQVSGTLEHVQLQKLAYSADGVRTLVTADADGLLVNLGANNDVTIATLPALAAGDNNVGNVDIVTVPAPLSTTGGGTEATALRVTLANDSTGLVSVDDNGASLSVDWAGTQPVTGSGTATGALRVELPTNGTGIVGLAAGTNGIGKLTANSGVDIGDVDVTSIAAGTNTIGDVGIKPRTTGGLTTYHLVSAATTNATNIKASAGQLFGWYIYNSNAAARKVAFHNTAGTPTAGASIFFTVFIPPLSAANVFSDIGIAFSTGIAITTVTGAADSDSAAVASQDLNINLWYA